MRLVPTLAQFRGWTLPSQASYLGLVVVVVIALGNALCNWFNSPADPEQTREILYSAVTTSDWTKVELMLPQACRSEVLDDLCNLSRGMMAAHSNSLKDPTAYLSAVKSTSRYFELSQSTLADFYIDRYNSDQSYLREKLNGVASALSAAGVSGLASYIECLSVDEEMPFADAETLWNKLGMRHGNLIDIRDFSLQITANMPQGGPIPPSTHLSLTDLSRVIAALLLSAHYKVVAAQREGLSHEAEKSLSQMKAIYNAFPESIITSGFGRQRQRLASISENYSHALGQSEFIWPNPSDTFQFQVQLNVHPSGK